MSPLPTPPARVKQLEYVATLAERCRASQKAYFSTRDTGALRLAKADEDELDHALLALRTGGYLTPAPTQPALLPED